MFLISFIGHSGVDSFWGTSAFRRPPPEPLSSLGRARVFTFHMLVSTCSLAFVSDGQLLIGNAWSCLYLDDLLLSKFSPGLEAGMDVLKVFLPAGRKNWGWSTVCVLSDSHCVHEACLGWCNNLGPGQTTCCTFGCADLGCGIWQYSQEETGWSSPGKLSSQR